MHQPVTPKGVEMISTPLPYPTVAMISTVEQDRGSVLNSTVVIITTVAQDGYRPAKVSR